jgi:hypothetical protein
MDDSIRFHFGQHPPEGLGRHRVELGGCLKLATRPASRPGVQNVQNALGGGGILIEVGHGVSKGKRRRELIRLCEKRFNHD